MHHREKFFPAPGRWSRRAAWAKLSSPGISLFATGRSSTGSKGTPVSRLDQDMAHFCIDDDRQRAVFPGEERGLRG